jgi:predicted Zn-dependent peptidase
MKSSSQKISRTAPRTSSRLALPSLAALPIPRRHKTTLPSGVRVLTEELPAAQSFALGVWIDAGSGDESRSEHGMAHLLEHVVFRGTQTRSARTIANYLESVGGYVNAFTTKDHTCYYTRALTPHFMRSLDLITDIVARPTLLERDLDKERAIILEEIKALEDEPEELINDYFDELLFGSHPYAHSISGSESSLQGITVKALQAFHRTRYAADRIIVAVAGNIRHEDVCKAAERLLGNVERSVQPPVRRAPRKRSLKSLRKDYTTPAQQAHYTTGALLTGLSDADYYALSALNIVLGDGMSSRLNQSIREQRSLCYNVYSSVNDIQGCSIFSIYAAMEASNMAKVERLVGREIEGILTTPIKPSELARAKEQLKSSLIIGLESLSGRMNLLAKSELYTGRYDEIAERIAAIEAVSAAQIHALVQERLPLAAWHTITMLPEE